MTSKDKTTAANVLRMNTNEVRKYEILSERAESSIANWVIGRPGLIKTSSGVCVTAEGLNLEDTVLFSDTRHLPKLIKTSNRH